MSYDAKVFNVMVASPGDVVDERDAFREVIHEWNVIHSEARKVVLMPVGWETHSSPEMGDEPQKIINKQVLHSCDLLVGIFWNRAGTPTTEFASGTVEEIERHIAAGRLAMLYFSRKPAAMDDVDFEQRQVLKRFQSTCRSRGLYESFDSLDEFRGKFSRQLQQKLNSQEMFKPPQIEGINRLVVSEDMSSEAPLLSPDAKTLLKVASQDSYGVVMYVRDISGSALQSNGETLYQGSDRRELVKWEAALRQLQTAGLMIETGKNGGFFEITAAGYEVVDKAGF
ncbi:DUF4062 domain-containing protein [Pseudomonas sp. fls2-241-R2A-110]|uniref:DUF4062 domain-containing protein n=1 Tax=Pseudomonas sp. fls2-241-R2A-110 TaxID=3040311 RepID=UPI002554B49C|nr:DUF4062 domain-containing protein [Pseudomonas sp. fls2-241-R2A-110]